MWHRQPKLITLVIVLVLLVVQSAQAQDEPSPYDIALQRIEEARHSNATGLYLAELGLTQLPPEIGQLSSLQELALWNNQLLSLPPEIGQLSNLRGLNLGGNQLLSLPPEIGRLRSLERLHLNYNQLVSLPPEIGQLNNLRWLMLNDNELTTLPSEIGLLSDKLCILDLSHNNLRFLPTALGNLNLLAEGGPCTAYIYGFYGLYLDNNPLISPPPEVIEQGTGAILDYLHNQAWYYTQRLILGAAGGVGLLVVLILGFRFKQRGARKEKPKRDAA
jgi:internalin A